MHTTYKRQLVFHIGEETTPVILGADNYTNTPFSGVLDKSMDELKRLIQSCDEHKRLYDIQGSPSERKQCPNNIISFLGDRGTGKTSCLLSIKKIIEDRNRSGISADEFKEIEFMPIIDPSFFDDNHNILEIFIGELYRNFRIISKDWNRKHKSEQEDLKDLQGYFTGVKKALKYIDQSNRNFDDEHSELLSLSDGVNLSVLIGNLISSYLKVTNKHFLVVSVDDIDMHHNHAFEMMEQIRKYLIQWNVAVLLAAKHEQLQHSVCRDLFKGYKDVVDKSISYGDIMEMAERYLNKFLPMDQRMFMPGHKEFYDSYPLTIISKGTDKEPDKYSSVQFAVLSLIFQKCGYLFYNSDDQSSLIIPRNLRELRHLITLLYNMESRHDGKEVHETNKALFKNYFFDQWLHLFPQRHREWLTSLIRESDLVKINKIVISYLAKTYNLVPSYLYEEPEEFDSLDSDTKRLCEIVNESNKLGNLSIGDVIFVLDKIIDISDSSDTYTLIFFIKTLYSMLIYEAYDALSSEATEKERENERENELPKLRKAPNFVKDDYFRIVGYNFFNLTGETFLPPASGSRTSREIVPIDGLKLFNEIREILDTKDDFIAGSVVNDERLRFNLVEFFILTTYRKFESKSGEYKASEIDFWRAAPHTMYFRQIPTNTRNLLFDVTAPFVNMINPEAAYRRFDSKFFDLALSYKDSILNKLYNHYRRYQGKRNEKADLMSRIAIRNIEVLCDIQNWLKHQRFTLRPEGNGDIGLLRNFYRLFGSSTNRYQIKTYDEIPPDKHQSIKYHDIDFRPLAILENFLSELIEADKNEQSTIINVFKRIYRLESHISPGNSYTVSDIEGLIDDSEIVAKENLKKSIGDIFGNMKVMRGSTLLEEIIRPETMDNDEIFNIFDKDSLTILKKEIPKRAESLMVLVRSLRRELTSTTQDLIKKEKELKKITDNIANHQLTINNLSVKTKELNQRLDFISSEIETLKNSFLSISEKIEQTRHTLFDEKIDADTKVVKEDLLKTMTEEKDKLEKRIDHLMNERSSVQMNVNEIDKEIVVSYRDLKALDTNKSEAEKAIGEMNDNIHSIDETRISTESDIRKLNKAVEKISILLKRVEG